jgi:hypothetical protein
MNKQPALDFIEAINTQNPETMHSRMTDDDEFIDAHDCIVVERRR